MGSGVVISTQGVIRWLWIAIVVLVGAGLATQVWKHSFAASMPFRTPEAVTLWFDVSQEANFPTWFSAACWLASAVAALVLAKGSPYKGPLKSRWWALLSLSFLLLSLEETVSFHERTVRPIGRILHTGGYFHYAWVILGALLVAGFVLFFRGFLAALPATTRFRLVVAGAVYVSGALGMEMIAGKYVSIHGEGDLVCSVLSAIEETLEMAGEVLCLRALLLHLETLGISFTVSSGT